MSVSVDGLVQSIRFANAENFWTVATLRTPKGDVSFVGSLPGLAEGMSVRLVGRWEESLRYGKQFKADSFTEVVPATVEGLKRYLASGFIQGIGDKLAERIVAQFGPQTIDIILSNPERLDEVPGLGKKRADALKDAFRERRGPQDALVFLLGLGIPRGLALRILKRYGDETVAAVRKNPFKLAQEVHGIGFIKAEQVARGLDIPLEHPERLRAGLIHILREARDEGHVRLGREVLLDLSEPLLAADRGLIDDALEGLCLEGRLVMTHDEHQVQQVYLASLHEAELGVAWNLMRIMESRRGTKSSEEHIERAAHHLKVQLAPGQTRAVKMALEEPMCVITGGPGTGKTTIIRTLLEACQLPPGRIALAAPTGRAAKRMSEATERQAQTLHRLLEFNPVEGGFNRDEDNPIDAELIIVDEASMVDLPLMYALLRAIPAACRLILVGDRDQLPPVGPGAPLTDLIRSERVPVARLTEIFRQGKGSAIVEAAHAINQGQALEPTPRGQAIQDFYFVTRPEPEQMISVMEHLILARIPERFGLDPVRDVQVLSPMRVGPLGVDLLNERLQALLNPLPKDEGDFKLEAPKSGHAPFREGDKVMQIRNDYEKNVFNGDVGYVRRVEAKQLQVEMDEKLVVYERDSWEDLVLAYAVTVHKSQGSEYPAVVMPVSTHHFKMLRRNLLYTGVTRGKKLVVLVGTEKAMRIAVSNASIEERNSGLAEALTVATRDGKEQLGFQSRKLSRMGKRPVAKSEPSEQDDQDIF